MPCSQARCGSEQLQQRAVLLHFASLVVAVEQPVVLQQVRHEATGAEGRSWGGVKAVNHVGRPALAFGMTSEAPAA